MSAKFRVKELIALASNSLSFNHISPPPNQPQDHSQGASTCLKCASRSECN
nr:MAG TPA_asm: hypothetical protein [Bacteriophage sp.]